MSGSTVRYDLIDAPWGPIHVAATERGVAAIELMTATDAFIARLERRFHAPVAIVNGDGSDDPASALVRRVEVVLEAYLGGESLDASLPLDLGDRPGWDRTVLDGVRSVGHGEVTSYGRLARRIGRPGANRAVGGAVGRNPIGILIPCHRVIAGDGSIGGYGGAWWGAREQLLEVKRELLRHEGVRLPVSWPRDPTVTTVAAGRPDGATGGERDASGRPR
ncbi:MAG TPA: methylated-DNA--[protein]-cysteine S-methyltransferase [Candidatus Limnocylindrales bacterium]|jgi:methylated-DNA-[protein]-cysteine S-methyltransferase